MHIFSISKRRGVSLSGSRSSLLSASGDSDEVSLECRLASEWPKPPEMPADVVDCCASTEDDDDDDDDVTSTCSDSAVDDIVPTALDLQSGHGTYVIRKGRNKERHKLFEMDSSICPLKTKPILTDDHLVRTNVKFVSSIRLPFSRHSIDLGSTDQQPSSVHNSIHHPR